MKYCKDCHWYKAEAFCFRPRPSYECPVRGVLTPTAPTDCYYEREHDIAQTCGPAGRFFEEKAR